MWIGFKCGTNQCRDMAPVSLRVNMVAQARCLCHHVLQKHGWKITPQSIRYKYKYGNVWYHFIKNNPGGVKY